MTNGSSEPDPIDNSKKVRSLPLNGSPLHPNDGNDQPLSNEGTEDSADPTSFASAELIETPISLGGVRDPKHPTKILNSDAEEKADQQTINTRTPLVEGISSIIGNRLNDGETIQFGDYELIEEIARGGMGVIFRARQLSLNRIVALKVILLGQFATTNDVRRFHAEAESAAALRHEGIVPVYASGEYEGNPYFSMQFIEGTTLSEMVSKSSIEGRAAAKLLSSIADAVTYAHLKGVIHRDLKPSNILVNRQGKPIITDFGLAKRTDTPPNLTGTGQIIGTPNFMSPEQASGLNHLTSTRSDIYSLGAILYAMLAGKPPFDAGTMIETLKQVATEMPAPLPRIKHKVDKDLEIIALKCLNKNPAERYQNAADLKADVDRYLSHQPIKASPASFATRASRWCRRNPVPATLSAILATLVIALAIGGPIIAYHQSKLQRRTRQSLEEQNKLAQELHASTAAINANLVKIYTERGDAAVSAGNHLAALPSYTAALKGSIESGQREWGHRFRVGSILQHAAVPTSMWELPGQPSATALSAGKEYVACTSRSGDFCLWNIITNEKVFSSTSKRRVSSATINFFDNDKKLLHTSGSQLRVLDLSSPGTPLVDIKMAAIIRAVAVDAGNQFCVVGTRDGQVTLLDIETGELIYECEHHKNTIRSVAISAKAGRIISACDDGRTKLFELATGQLIHTARQNKPTNHIEFSPDGKKYLCCSDDNTMLILNAETGQPHSTPVNCSSNIQTAKFNHASSQIATGTSDATVQIWDSDTSAALTHPMMHKNSIRFLEFNADDTLLVTSSTDHTSCVWDSHTGAPVCPPMPHSYIVEASFFIRDDGILTVSGDRMIRHWKLQNKSMVSMTQTPNGISNALAVSQDGSLFITGGTTGLVQITKTKTNTRQGGLIDHGKEITCIAMSPDNDLIVVGDTSIATSIYRLSRPGERIQTSNNDALFTMKAREKKPLLSVQFSPDGSRLLVVHDGNEASVYRTDTGVLLYNIRHSRSLLNAKFSQDGTRILSASRDGTAILWDAQTGDPTGIELVHKDYVDACAISPDGKIIASGSRDHTAKILNVQTGEQIGPNLQHQGGIVSITFAPDGKSVATGSRDGVARIWRLNQLNMPLTMQAGLGRVFVKYSPDGNILLTANEKQIRLWDTVDGKSLGTVLSHHSDIDEFYVTPDSNLIIASTVDGNIKTWQMPSADMSPIHELEARVELVTGYRADFRQGLKLLTPRQLRKRITQSVDTP